MFTLEARTKRNVFVSDHETLEGAQAKMQRMLDQGLSGFTKFQISNGTTVVDKGRIDESDMFGPGKIVR